LNFDLKQSGVHGTMRQSVSEDPLDKWESDFRAAAIADGFAIFRDHLRRLDLPDEPQSMLEGTVRVMRMCAAYLAVDNRDGKSSELLAMQTYNPAEATGACYVFTFDLCGQAYARVLVETKVQTLDLADLYGNPWWDYEVVGFSRLWISHPDWSNLTAAEKKQLEEEVTDDLLFDYDKDEIEFWFDDSQDDRLYFDVHDNWEAQDKDDD